jgi:hypothetical protein
MLSSIPTAMPPISGLFVHNNLISRFPRGLIPLWSTLRMLITLGNPSRCFRAIDPILKTVEVVCDCAEGYYGIHFCEPLNDYVELPVLSSVAVGVHLEHPVLENGRYDSDNTTFGDALCPNEICADFFPEISNLVIPLALESKDGDDDDNNESVTISIMSVGSVFQLEPRGLSGDYGMQSFKILSIAGSVNSPLESHSLRPPVNPNVPTLLKYQFSTTSFGTEQILADAGITLDVDSGVFSGASPIAFRHIFAIIVTDVLSGESKFMSVAIYISDCGNYTCASGGVCDAGYDAFDDIYTCVCEAGFTGLRCEEKLADINLETQGVSTSPSVIGGAVGGGLFVVLVIAIVLLLLYRVCSMIYSIVFSRSTEPCSLLT